MASHAIGDMESLLEASGIDDDEHGGTFDEKILRLVLAALAGKDVEKATQKAEQSILDAKTEESCCLPVTYLNEACPFKLIRINIAATTPRL